jgi:hypothetical protein
VLTRNYAATQRFHKLNIHSFMPEHPHKRICPEITQYTPLLYLSVSMPE